MSEPASGPAHPSQAGLTEGGRLDLFIPPKDEGFRATAVKLVGEQAVLAVEVGMRVLNPRPVAERLGEVIRNLVARR